ncbi:hypothetical protein PG2029B_1225 [Bifidobacterium pseudolongum subsp. globosum]|uniref:Lipoprotein n=1 Tax=Bifidobacterium pseudolongum subsp. globosum TaxID=1690 RepID=A0A4V1Y3B6_9BIFI|nr:hypothetical protein [Bifidobacterium pseudolongum]RYQ26628.1 hypothetical protein PG2032B_1224 [Bifidobacterium pseudolongum subsp. globosum]RYQ28620.1 hypothetical protein PG2029B_1225 [Bifidobacterium pseudolongum subsp. globosum]
MVKRGVAAFLSVLLMFALSGLSACGAASSTTDGTDDFQNEQSDSTYESDESYDSDSSDMEMAGGEYQIEDCDGLCVYNESTGQVTLIPKFYTQLEVGGIVELNGDKCEPEKMKHYYDSYDYYSCALGVYSATQNDDFVELDKSVGDELIYVSNQNYEEKTFGFWEPRQSGYWDARPIGNYDVTFLDALMGEEVTNESSETVQRILQDEGLSILRVRANGITKPTWSSYEGEDTSSMYVVSEEKSQYSWAQYQGTKYVEAYNDSVIPYVVNGVGDKIEKGERLKLGYTATKNGYFKIDADTITEGKVWCGSNGADETGRWTYCFNVL